MTIRATFRKHFDSDGQADDYPTDFFRPPDGALEDMTFVEMREPKPDAERDEDGGAYGQEIWEYKPTEGRANAVEAALNRCVTCISYSVRRECRAFVHQPERTFQSKLGLVRFSIKSNPHDFGDYLDVVASFDDSDEAAARAAYEIENNVPAEWDDTAKQELN